MPPILKRPSLNNRGYRHIDPTMVTILTHVFSIGKTLSRGGANEMATLTLPDLINLPEVWDRIGLVEERLLEVSAAGDPHLTEITQHLLVAGGKRFRPILAQLAGEFGPSRDQRLVDAGAAVELIHVGSLYHDDVIDEAETRRGTLSVNVRWKNSQAILAGDFLIARASEIAAKTLGLETVTLLAQTYTELVEGQALELHLTGDLTHGPTEHYRIMEGKTASLIRTAARMGAIAADASREFVEALSTATWELGMVFQITDDALDLVATDEQIGKPAGSDIRQGVYTLPVLYALKGSTGPRIRELLGGGMPYSDHAVEEVIGLVREGGYIDRVLEQCVRRLDIAAEAIDSLPDIAARSVLRTMGAYLVDRVHQASG